MESIHERLARETRERQERIQQSYAQRTTTSAMPRMPGQGSVVDTIKNWGAGGLRFLTGALEPLQLPQDIAFAVAADLMESGTVGPRTRQVQWAKYAPFGATPARPATGEELLRLAGVQDERALRWGGLATDLIADPLIAGSVFRGASRALNAPGLAKVGDRLDAYAEMALLASPMPIPTARSVGEIKRLATSTGLVTTQAIEKRTEMVFGALHKAWNAGIEVPRTGWNFRESEAQILGMKLETVLPWLKGKYTLGERYGTGHMPFDRTRDAIAGGSGRPLELINAERKAQAGADDMAVRMSQEMSKLVEDVFGKPIAQGWWHKLGNALGRPLDVANELGGTPTMFRDSILTRAHRYADEVGGTAIDLGIDTKPVRTVLGHLSETQRQQFSKAERLNEQVAEVRDWAVKHGFKPDDAEAAFRKATKGLVQADIELGHVMSGFDEVMLLLRQRLKEGGIADDAIEGVISEMVMRGMRGEDALATLTPIMKAPKPEKTLTGRQAENRPLFPEVMNPPEAKTIGDLLGKESKLNMLNLSDYLKSYSEGHLRRQVGAYFDKSDLDAWGKTIEKGLVMPNKVLDESSVFESMKKMPEFQKEAALVESYVKSVGEKSTLVAQDALYRHLIESGVSAKKARETIAEMVHQMNPSLREHSKRLQSLVDRHALGPRKAGQLVGDSLVDFYATRENLTPEVLGLLGDLSNPLVSIGQSIKGMHRALPMQELVRNVYKIAKDRNVISNTEIDGFVRIPKNAPDFLGPLAGKWVHPWIKKELYIAMTDQHEMGASAMRRISSALGAGYLAGPFVSMNNLGGNILVAALGGMNPLALTKNIAEAALEEAKSTKRMGRHSDDWEEMNRFFPVLHSTAAQVELSKMYRGQRSLDLGPGIDPVNRIKAVIDDMELSWRSFVERPGGQQWLGLEGFQYMENMTRLGIYRMMKANGASPEDAAQAARLMVFDYNLLPQAHRTLRDAGLALFPGFPHFVIGRTLDAAIHRPGKLAMMDRLPEAVWNAQIPDEAEKYALFASLSDYMHDGGRSQFVPWRKSGDSRYHLLPLGQMLPQSSFLDRSWGEQIPALGVWRPFFEIAYALALGDGEAPLSKRFGQRVFPQLAGPGEKAMGVANFAYTNLMPSFMTKLFRPDDGTGTSGMVPNITRAALDGMGIPVTRTFGDTTYSFAEVMRRRPDKDWMDEAMSLLYRASTPIETQGPLSNIYRAFNSDKSKLNNRVSVLKQRYQRAEYMGDTERMAEIRMEYEKLASKFKERWEPAIAAFRRQGQ